MDKSALKKYAPRARNDFIAAVTRRAETLGLNPEYPATVEQGGDAMLINGQPFPASLKRQRDTLQQRIEAQGFDAVMDAIAYTWFNRLVAIRYMELHDFLGHGYRVLSHPQGHAQPEILEHVADIELNGLDRQRALELKLAGNRDEELYRELLLAQCHALHVALPFLFESIDDATELLLPDGLLRTDSLIRDLVTRIDEASWQAVEIIGWLYQFYISEKKEQVIGKVVKSEDIPAATQLFTPNWIVKYLVQNSLGRLWLMANPGSQLAAKWDYYIEPAEQTPEVNAQLDELIQTRIAEDGNTLNPESLTLLDPACGSGHILVEAYDLLRDIYLERGYRRRDIPRLILENNLHGLDIDDRAAQLSGFALLMKARADDRRLLSRAPSLNVHALQQTTGNELDNLPDLAPYAQQAGVAEAESITQSLRLLVQTFTQAKTFGSLIQIPDELATALPALQQTLEAIQTNGGLFERDVAQVLLPVVAQARVLAGQYDGVVTNPPYMGSIYFNSELKKIIAKYYSQGKNDVYGCFLLRCKEFASFGGYIAMITIHNWMFISSFKKLRNIIINDLPIHSLVHNGRGVWGSDFGSCSFVLQKIHQRTNGIYKRLFEKQGSVSSNNELRRRYFEPNKYIINIDNFNKIPSKPIVYWLTKDFIDLFGRYDGLTVRAESREGMTTADNDRFLRYFHEVDYRGIEWGCRSDNDAIVSGKKWFPYLKGGEYRKWYGNLGLVVNWENGGTEIKSNVDPRTGRVRSHNYNGDYAFREGFTWTLISSASTSARFIDQGFMFDANGPMAFASDDVRVSAISLMNSVVGDALLAALSPSLAFKHGHVLSLPLNTEIPRFSELCEYVEQLRELSKQDWEMFERSWNFQCSPLIPESSAARPTLSDAYYQWTVTTKKVIDVARDLETKNNEIMIDAYDLHHELLPESRLSDVTLTVNPYYRYGGDADAEELWNRFRQDTHYELISYITGCIMGRYSLDEPGLIYAHAGNEGFDPGRYITFPADEDGIVPITDQPWFDDDAANRVREFVRVVWGKETEDENMAWLAESLGSKRGESADDTIRRYLSTKFYKDHLKTYKKRPIYWLFSSGKQKAFEALVYLHRYNAGTLSRMRMEYVVPLQSRIQSRIESLDQDIPAATSSAETKRLQKQRDKLAKQLDELRHFDERLRHYADQRITLDLDDGVKVNYGKFGDLLAEVKAVTGKKAAS